MEEWEIKKETGADKRESAALVKRDRASARAVTAATHEAMLCGEESLFWLNSGKLGQAFSEPKICVNTQWGPAEKLLSDVRPRFAFGGVKAKRGQGGSIQGGNSQSGGVQGGNSQSGGVQGGNSQSGGVQERCNQGESGQGSKEGKARVNLLALGDVGGTVLIGLKLLGGDVISEIGICDIDENVCRRWEYEMNQTVYPWDYGALPQVNIVGREALFDCDVFVFCASKGVPPVGAEAGDVRMMQFEANRRIAGEYAKMAREAGFSGLFAVVSDPVEPLCREVFRESNRQGTGDFDGKGLRPEQIQGYGLGVMNGRAAYYAERDDRFLSFLTEGRAYGPHGKDLVIANSIERYDDELSKELTRLAAEANLRTRETGFKPYIAPALSSAAISILLTLRGRWHYSSVFLGGVYMGCKNRFGEWGLETESLPLPDALYSRLLYAYEQLDGIQ